MVGNVIKDSVIPPTKDVDLGSPKTLRSIPNPNRPKTIDGTAAKLLILISIISVKVFFGANSSK